jgi:bifunctional DNase/RNase
MRSYLKMGGAGLLLFSFVFASAGKETLPAFIEMEVKGVRLDIIGQSPVVILADKEGNKALPIWIGLPEANAIDKELRNILSPRPMTHDLLHSILTQVKVKVKEV